MYQNILRMLVQHMHLLFLTLSSPSSLPSTFPILKITVGKVTKLPNYTGKVEVLKFWTACFNLLRFIFVDKHFANPELTITCLCLTLNGVQGLTDAERTF